MSGPRRRCHRSRIGMRLLFERTKIDSVRKQVDPAVTKPTVVRSVRAPAGGLWNSPNMSSKLDDDLSGAINVT